MACGGSGLERAPLGRGRQRPRVGPPRPQNRVPFTWFQARTEACVPGSAPSPSSLLFQPQPEEAGTRSARPVPLALPAQAP